MHTKAKSEKLMMHHFLATTILGNIGTILTGRRTKQGIEETIISTITRRIFWKRDAILAQSVSGSALDVFLNLSQTILVGMNMPDFRHQSIHNILACDLELGETPQWLVAE
jgi:hypothetical protein